MHITLVTALAPFDETGGSERTIAQWLSYLADLGHQIEVIAYGDSEESEGGPARHNLTYLDDKAPVGTVDSYMETTAPDVVLTVGGWSDIALWAADKHGIPCVLFVMSNFELQIQSGLASDSSPDHVIAVSDEFRARAKGVYRKTPVTTIYQPIDFDFYTLEEHTPERVTIINPVDVKGGFLFREIAEKSPDENFLAKMGWSQTRDADNSFKTNPYDIYSRTLGERIRPPLEPDFSANENIEFIRDGDIRDIYRRTKILLVPSQWQESFGRVVIEAMHNGIPVIASDIGGLPEACGGAGLLIDDYDQAEAWVQSLEKLHDPETYHELATQGEERAARYQSRANEDIERLGEVVRSVTQS